MNFDDIKNIHFVGIGGIGMSGIAEILADAGVTVSGCDLKRSAATDLLQRRGIRVTIGHDPAAPRRRGPRSSSPRPSKASTPRSTPPGAAVSAS